MRAVRLFAAGLAIALPAAAALEVNGSTTVNPVVADAAEILRAERGWRIHVDTLGGSSGGLSALGDGRIQVAMSSRPILAADRARFPRVDFHSTAIGADAVALAVSRDVWEGGMRSLGRRQVRDLYEGRITNWAALGGPDRRVVFYDKEPGRGTWEVFAQWLYGDARRAPAAGLLEVGANEEARTKLRTTRGAITQLSAAWVDGETLFALGIETGDGEVVAPTPEAIARGDYPLVRPLLLVTDGPPRGEARALVDLLLSPRGQALVTRHGYLPLARFLAEGP